MGTVSKIMVVSKITFEFNTFLTITKLSHIHIVPTAFKILPVMKVIPNFQAVLLNIYSILQWHVLVVLQADWVTMNYVPFGEKALTMVVNLYQQTAHDMSVIQFNILHNIIEVCYSLLVSMLCKVNYSTNPFVCVLVCLFLCVKDVASIVQSVKSGNLNHFCSSVRTFHMMKLLSLHDRHTVER